jgi:NitT/TauT family transport system substrate-binding protein
MPWKLVLSVVTAATLVASGGASAEKISVSATKSLASAGLFIAEGKGYFRDAGLEVEFKWFNAAQPVAVAVASGDATFGITGFSAGLFNMAAKQSIKIISGGGREAPKFSGGAYFVSNESYEKGIRTPKDLAGRTFGLTTFGSPYHYALALLSDKYGFPLASIKMTPLQTFGNVLTAVKGNRVEAGLLNAYVALPAEQRGEGKIIGWTGDETPWQLSAMLASVDTLTKQRPMVQRFLAAYRKGAADFYDAFIANQDPAKRETEMAILEQFSGLTREQIMQSLNFIPRDAALDVKDIEKQIEIWKKLGMVNADVEAKALIDLSAN